MSDEEGAARASTGKDRQHTPLFDLAPARGDSNRERTPPRGQGAQATRAPLLYTQARDREDIGTECCRRGSGSEERHTLRWERTPSPPGDTLRPLYGKTPRYLFTAGSATYQHTYVRDHGNALRIRPRTVTQNYATGPHTRVRANRTPEAEQPLPPYGTCLNIHTTHQPVSLKEGRAWTGTRRAKVVFNWTVREIYLTIRLAKIVRDIYHTTALDRAVRETYRTDTVSTETWWDTRILGIRIRRGMMRAPIFHLKRSHTNGCVA